MTTKERPIIFDAASVRAILTGAKTQTRRVIKPQPKETYPGADIWMLSGKAVTDEYINPVIGSDTLVDHYWHNVDSISPYGGGEYMDGTFDRLWVREACRAEELEDGTDGVRYLADNAFREIGNSEEEAEGWLNLYNKFRHGSTVSPIHMPRWASRITLQVGDVRVQRLQQISDADIEAEMAWSAMDDNAPANFADRWDAINAKRGYAWQSNPWVWVVEFKVVQP